MAEMQWGGESVGSGVPTEVPRADVSLAEFSTWVAHARGRPRLLDRIVRQLKVLPTTVGPWARVQPHRYTRTLVYRDAQVELLVLAWAPGAVARVHDHGGQRCWVQVVTGVLEMTDFRRVRGGKRPGPARLSPLGSPRRLVSGDVDIRGVDARVHGVRAPMQDGVAVSVHVYSKPIDRCLVFDLEAGRCSLRKLHYDFEGPKRAREVADPDPSDL